jgi:hypothetical protein
MEWFWTWGGRCFGYRDGDNLWTYDGKHVGKFYDNEVYDQNGRYLGEIMNDNRLIRNKSKHSWNKYSFAPYSNRGRYAKYADYAGYAMYAGYEDLPKLEGD